MPELPEMETYRTLLATKIVGKTIQDVDVQREKSVNVSVDAFIGEVQGSVITHMTRRAKHLVFHLDNGKLLVLHLMLGGWMFYGTMEQKPDRTTQIVLSFPEGQKLFFIGLRLGYLHLLTEGEAEERFKKLGPEPLDVRFTEIQFRELLHVKRGILKIQLLDQSFVAGIGNCYADEICFHAKVLPTHRISTLNETVIAKLYSSMREVLLKAIQNGGYMENRLYESDRLTGNFDTMCCVYDREEEPCFRCGQPIKKEMVQSRKVFYCLGCQH